MRLPTSKVYRAFPELDEFGDAQCRAWLRSANTGFLWRLMRMALFGAVFLFWLVIVSVTLAAVGSSLSILDGRPVNDRPALSLLGVGAAIGIGLGIVWVLMLRDGLLRRRVRRVMELRGACDGCRYVLVGLPVTDGRVTCPECGRPRVPDEKLAEVVADAGGVPRYLPSAKNVPEMRTWLTPERQRRVFRVLRWTVAFASLFVGAVAGSYELFLRWQGSSARAARPGFRGLMEFAEANQPACTTPLSPDAWDAFDVALGQLLNAGVAGDMNPASFSASSVWWVIDPSVIYDVKKPYSLWEHMGASRIELARLLSLEMLEVASQNGAFAAADEMLLRSRSLREYTLAAGAPLVDLQPGFLWDVHLLTRCNLARMHLSAEQNDPRTYFSALEQNLALVRMVRYQPFHWTGRFTDRLDRMTHREVMKLLTKRPTREWVAAIKECLARQSDVPDFRYALDAQRLAVLDTICWLYAEPEHVRWGSFSPAFTALWERHQVGRNSRPPLWVGTFAGERSKLDAAYATWVAAYSTDAWKRAPIPAPGTGEFSVVEMLTLSTLHPQVLAMWDWQVLTTRGLRVMIALEEYRIDHGEYPMALDVLAPRYLPTIPVDPWSGRELRYCRELEDSPGVGYVLYSVGIDGVDDAGLTPHEDPTAGVTQPGWDVVLSDEAE